jgi:hypothetical protein
LLIKLVSERGIHVDVRSVSGRKGHKNAQTRSGETSTPFVPFCGSVPRTLIADDQPDVLTALRLLLKGAGYQTQSADSPAAVLNALRAREV